MDRAEFMRQLEGLLQNISPTERADALRYYNDYFDDAGPENEQAVIESLGSPARVAENIRRDVYGGGCGDDAYRGVAGSGQEVAQYQGQDGEACGQGGAPARRERIPAWAVVLIAVLCVIASPVLLGVASGILGVAVGGLAAWFSLILASGLVALALIAVLVVLAVVGVMCMVVSPLAGIALVGAGMVCGGVGLLFLMLAVAMAGIATPGICRGIGRLCQKAFRKKEAYA